MMEKSVAVVGGGIIGLSTALAVQERCPGVQVTIITEKITPDTTADGAAGIFGLYLLGATNADTQVRWAKRTHDKLESWWKSPLGGKMGVSLVSCTRLNHSPVPPIWSDVVYGLREMEKQEVNSIGRLSGRHDSGLEMVTFTAEPVRFLPYMFRDFKSRGGQLVMKKVANLQELLNQYSAVVNCTGVWAGELTGDTLIRPLRGQVMRVSAPWIRTVCLDDRDDGNYVIANQESVVVGGTHQDSDWDTSPRDGDTNFIKEGGKCLEPSLDRAEFIKHWVGLRPGRASVRLEREGERLIHNYGHGGSGITTFQGCADDAAELVAEALGLPPRQAMNLKSKL